MRGEKWSDHYTLELTLDECLKPFKQEIVDWLDYPGATRVIWSNTSQSNAMMDLHFRDGSEIHPCGGTYRKRLITIIMHIARREQFPCS